MLGCCDGHPTCAFAAIHRSGIVGWHGSAGYRQPKLVLLGQQPREQVCVAVTDSGYGTVVRFWRSHALGTELCVTRGVGGLPEFSQPGISDC